MFESGMPFGIKLRPDGCLWEPYQKWSREGRIEGRAEGFAAGRAEVLRRLTRVYVRDGSDTPAGQ